MALAGTEILYVTPVQGNGQLGAIFEQTTAQAIADLGTGGGPAPSFTLSGATSGTTVVQPTAIASGTLTLPAATDTLVGKATTDVLTNKTLTAPVLGGSVTGTYTLAGTPTITAPAITSATLTTPTVGSAGATFNGSSSGTTILKASAAAGSTTQTMPAVTGTVSSTTGSNLNIEDVYRCTAPVTKNANITYADVTGLTATVVVGTYKFRAVLPSTVASGTGGIKYAFHYTTAALSALESTACGFTASAVAVQHSTTTTDVADLFTQAAVVIYTEINGTFTVSTGGTIAVQMAQNTSNASDTIALLGGSFTVTRIA